MSVLKKQDFFVYDLWLRSMAVYDLWFILYMIFDSGPVYDFCIRFDFFCIWSLIFDLLAG
jgi:hypothetical protein